MPAPLLAVAGASALKALFAKIAMGATVAAGAQYAYEAPKAASEANEANALKMLRNSSQKYDFLAGMSDRELKGYLDNYKSEDNGLGNLWGLFNDNYVYDTRSMLADLERLSKASADMPTAPDLDQLRTDAENAINAENAEILGMYDADKQRQADLYSQQLSDSNAAYNRNVEQILSNDYQKNAQLMGTIRSEMQRSQRNALESGASAGMRIAENINTTLSLQNRQSQQSLETSNNLAQMLLNQQQANAGLRSEYGNYLSQDTANRASLKHGTAERVNSYYNDSKASAYDDYNQKMSDFETNYRNTVGATNPFANAYLANLQKSQYSQK